MVEVRKTGVSARPHSAAARNPVHSPAPFSTAPPAGTGLPNTLPPGSMTVTPVLATPRPAGGAGSSRQTVTCPTPRPGTSVIDAVGPLGSTPILMPRSRARVVCPFGSLTQRACHGRVGSMTIEGAALGMPVVWHEDCLLHQPAGEVWLGLREEGTEVPERATVILQTLTGAGARVVAPRGHDDAALLAVHDRALVEHLATIWTDWEAGEYPARYGRD